MANSNGTSIDAAAMLPAIHPMVSVSPPREIAPITASSKDSASRKQIMDSATVLSQAVSKAYEGRISSVVRLRS